MGDDGRFSVAFPHHQWYPAIRSDALRRTPQAIALMETPIALFRDAGGHPRAVLDRCPHRNVALSLGRIHADGTLECGYHGWRFDGTGACTAIPGLALDDTSSPARNIDAFATCEQDGFVWIWGAPGTVPAGDPFRLPDVSGSNTAEVVFSYDLECTMHAALENALDVPHTAFLHRGAFRGGEPRAITAVRRDVPGGLEVEYLGEPVGVGRFRGTQDAALTFEHWDRFFLPCVAQIEYRVEGWLRIVNTIVHLPLSPFVTRAWFVVRFWTRFPAAAVKPIVLARGHQILRQDARLLAEQTRQAQRFGGERYTSTELDLMGNGIWKMLRQAERAERAAAGAADECTRDDGAPDEPVERTVVFEI